MFFKYSFIFFICLIVTIKTQAEPLSSEQIDVEEHCINAIIVGGPSLLNQALDECPSSMPGNRIAGIELNRKQVSLIARKLSGVVNNYFRNVIYNSTEVVANHQPNIRNSLGQTGYSAGDTFENIGIWGNFSYDNLDNDFVNTPFDSNTKSFLAGADIQPSEDMIIGLAFGYEDTNVDTDFNTGEQDIDGYTFAGYFGYLINNYFSIDASGGYSSLDIDQTRLSDSLHLLIDPVFGGLPVGSRINGEVDVDRFFITANINGFWTVNNFIIGAHAGYLWAEEEHDSFTETTGTLTDTFSERNFDLGQVRTGINIAYDYQSFLEPYFGIEYINETTREDLRLIPGMAQPSNDDDELLWSIGMRYFGNYGITGDLQWNISSSREDIDAHTFMFLLRADL